jgi:hypothetical protein
MDRADQPVSGVCAVQGRNFFIRHGGKSWQKLIRPASGELRFFSGGLRSPAHHSFFPSSANG